MRIDGGAGFPAGAEKEIVDYRNRSRFEGVFRKRFEPPKSPSLGGLKKAGDTPGAPAKEGSAPLDSLLLKRCFASACLILFAALFHKHRQRPASPASAGQGYRPDVRRL